MHAKSLDNLLARVSISANLFHSGPLCGVTDEPMIEGRGYLHVVQNGLADVRHHGHPTLHIVEPTLLLYAHPLAHRFTTDEHSGANFVCATVAFNAGRCNPIVQALPPVLALPLAAMPELRATTDLLFAETFGREHARQATADRLLEVLLIQVLRRIVETGTMSTGMLAGLAHPQLGAALVALHDAPARSWTLDALAAVAGMSRSAFAKTFKRVLGTTPGDYLCDWRLSLAQDQLRLGRPLKEVAPDVGYGSAVALARAFRLRLGLSPRAWLQAD